MPPIDELVATILSQHTSDINTERAFASLRAAFPTWDDVIAATDDAVADAIRMRRAGQSESTSHQRPCSPLFGQQFGSFDLTELGDS